jgi:hypothetical protein
MNQPVVGNLKRFSLPIVFIHNQRMIIGFSFMNIASLSGNMLSVCFGRSEN